MPVGWGGGWGLKMDMVAVYRNWRENEKTWQLKPKRTAAASCGFLSAARLSCCMLSQFVDRRTKWQYADYSTVQCVFV